MSHILMYERLSSELKTLSRQVGIERLTLPDSNPTVMQDGRMRRDVDYRADYDARMTERVRVSFWRDIELFGYEFDGVKELP